MSGHHLSQWPTQRGMERVYTAPNGVGIRTFDIGSDGDAVTLIVHLADGRTEIVRLPKKD